MNKNYVMLCYGCSVSAKPEAMQYILIFEMCVTVGDISDIQNSFYLIRYNSTSAASNKSFGFEYQDILSLVLSRQQLLTITSVDLQMYCLRAITATYRGDACFLLSFEI